MIDELLQGNEKFLADEFRPHADSYHAIADRQTPKVLWIGCSDSRVSEHQMTGRTPNRLRIKSSSHPPTWR